MTWDRKTLLFIMLNKAKSNILFATRLSGKQFTALTLAQTARPFQPLLHLFMVLHESLEVLHGALSDIKACREADEVLVRFILTMQMRHLYRSPLSICFSSSLIRAFRASMVVAVDSSSVTLGGEEEKETEREKCLLPMLQDA